MSKRPGGGRPHRAVAYVRMRVDADYPSAGEQMDVICEHAKRRGLKIMKVYSEGGRHGKGGALP